MYKTFLILAAGLFSIDVISYDPLLTYTVRLNKITFYHNISGNYTVNHRREQEFYSANIEINSNYLLDSTTAVIYRCNSEGFDCEYWQTWKFMDICKIINEKNQIWSKMVVAFHPPFYCPINKVNYQVENLTIDSGPLLFIYPEGTNYQWKATTKFFSGDVYVGAVMMDWKYFGYRKRTKSIFNKKN